MEEAAKELMAFLGKSAISFELRGKNEIVIYVTKLGIYVPTKYKGFSVIKKKVIKK